jgi:hypothetical protein
VASWKSEFEIPIELPDGRELVTLEDAAAYIAKLPKAQHRLPHWQLAGSILISAAEGRDFTLHARIAMLKAIHHGKPPPAPGVRKKAAKRFRIITGR